MAVGGGGEPFPTVDNCDATSRAGEHYDTVVSDLDGTLLRSRDAFPHYALVSFDVGGAPRLLFLLLLTPLAAALRHVAGSESAAVRVLVFAATVGARVADVESAARAVLPAFYAADVHPAAWRVFSRGGAVRGKGRRMVVFAEPFLRGYLGVDAVAGTELVSWRGRATGLVDSRRGVLVGERKAEAVGEMVGEYGGEMPDVGLGDGRSDYAFMSLCKKFSGFEPMSHARVLKSEVTAVQLQEAYLVPREPVDAVPANKLPRPVIFHDGRLVHRPTPLAALLAVSWLPFGFLLACLRVAAGSLLPIPFRALGVRLVVRGAPPPPASARRGRHRTVLDAFFLSVAAGRPIPAVTFSVSRLTELLSPIPTLRLTRRYRAADAAAMRRVLVASGELAVCPEGTTCREAYLLRFSPLFAELADEIVPVATACRAGMFHGTTARGWIRSTS
uniref:Phospholipid/glycerol acyltransferase domain-containing protein n=1 Tax=Leersia perrieri TaxID=77586 RepID=A0A0D9VPX7_9ORYZ